MADKSLMLINGEWVESKSRQTAERKSPVNGETAFTYAKGGKEDADAAAAAARKAFDSGPWPGMTGQQRGELLVKIAEKIRHKSEDMAKAITREMGRPIREARNEVKETAEVFEYFGGMAWNDQSKAVNNAPGGVGLILREPVGVVAAISPWNFPLLLSSWKIAPALAAGCTVIHKSSSYTPGVGHVLAQAIHEAGIPAGVFNYVMGPGSTLGDALTTNPQVDKVAFTGSTVTGRDVMRNAADTIKRVSLELGGKSPNIVFNDADLRGASAGVQLGIFFNQGEVCQAGSRLLVQEDIHDELLKLVIERAKGLKMGDPWDENTRMGAIVSEEQLQTVQEYIAVGQEEGAKLVYGGNRLTEAPFDKGYYLQPTIFDGVTSNMRIAQEEIFGPVLSVLTFKDEADAIRIANDTIYGLAGAVWTKDLNRAMRVVRGVKAGTMFVNAYLGAGLPLAEMPFGGFKQSGFGRELGEAGLEQFKEIKSVHWRMTV